MELPSKYDSRKVEGHWYDYWMQHDFFSSKPDDREPYTIVIPPPNVTGVLHMGHMLNNTIQDVLIRKARLEGKNACWVPGMDHASIATEAKVVAKLKESRTKFTMDDDMSASVLKVFVDLYNKGLIYRGFRMVNWDPEAKTTLSDEEVHYEERQGLLYYLSYEIEGSDDKVTIATTRPETILGDTAICINPNDERYTHLRGKKAIVPICGRVIPIIEDEYVDIEFGTGCLKVTPAHDENDKTLGEKHQLEVIDIFNEDASINSFGMHYQGKDRFVVRKEIAKELEEKGFLIKTEQHLNKVGTSERTKAVIEPRLSDQWFLKMEELAKPAIDAVLKDGDVKLFPKKFENTYRHWMENIRDWNISRQLWWGQQIPAYFYGDGKEDFVVAVSKEEALEKAKVKNPNIKLSDLRQDVDVLDTWFSSWLWPISVFGGILEPDNEEVNYYYPTNDLVTGPDILFFWVARMIVAGYEFRDKRPYENVYLTGLVRDKQRRKMSKSLGNSPDALKLIEEYGADGVRVGLLLSSAAGNDLMFDETLCQQGKNFANKIWNAFRLVKGWEVAEGAQPEAAKLGIAWYTAKFNKTLIEIEDHYSKYRISDALMAIYKLVWDDFCSWFLEIVKPEYQKPIDQKTLSSVIHLFEENLRLLHPFMPFLSEEVWQHMSKRSPEEALCVANWPKKGATDNELINNFDIAADVISGVRTIRKSKNIPNKEVLDLMELSTEDSIFKMNAVIEKLSNVSTINSVNETVDGALSFRVGSNEYFIPIAGAIDVEEEIKKINEELKYTKGFLQSVQKKLSNERFVNNAPEKVVEIERKKVADAEAKIETLEKSLASLS